MCNGKARVHFQCPSTLLHRFNVEVSDAQCIRQVRANDEGEGIQALRCSQLSDALAASSRHDQMPSIPVMSRRVTGIQRDCALVFLLRRLPVPLIKIDDNAREVWASARLSSKARAFVAAALALGKASWGERIPYS